MQVRNALAMGADRGIRVDATDEQLDADIGRAHRAKVVEARSPTSSSWASRPSTATRTRSARSLAGLLGWPQATFAGDDRVTDGGKALLVGREVDAGRRDEEGPAPRGGHGRSAHHRARTA